MARGENTKALMDLVGTITEELVKEPSIPVKGSDRHDVEVVVQDAVSQSAVGNKLNAEAPYQSRVLVGIIISSIGTIFGAFGHAFTPEEVARYVDAGTAIVTLGGLAYSAYGRFWPGLKPLFSRG